MVEVPTAEKPAAEPVAKAPAVEQPAAEPVVETPTVVATDVENNVDNQTVYEKKGVTEDRGIIVNTAQAEKSRASFDVQNVTQNEVSKEKTAPQEQPVIPVVEQPAESVSNAQDLEQMMQQMQQEYAKGNTAKAEELSNAISEMNKTLQKTNN